MFVDAAYSHLQRFVICVFSILDCDLMLLGTALWQFFETELKVPLGNVCGMLLVGTWVYLSCGT